MKVSLFLHIPKTTNKFNPKNVVSNMIIKSFNPAIEIKKSELPNYYDGIYIGNNHPLYKDIMKIIDEYEGEQVYSEEDND